MAVVIPQVITEDRASGGQVINGSLRFNSATPHYLTRTNSSTITNNKIMTFSFWVKRGTLGTSDFQTIIGGNGPAAQGESLGWGSGTNNGGDSLHIRDGSAGTYVLTTTQIFRDPNAWYHVVMGVDTTQATNANRIKLYVNGFQITSFSSSTYPSLNYVPDWNTASRSWRIGVRADTSTTWALNSYLSELHFIDGQALDASYFGFTDPLTNTWRPKKYTGTYGTNGFYLPLDDDNAKGTDRSGNGNNWTATNFTGTSSNPDVVPDSPSGISYSTTPTSGITTTSGMTKPNNYCTLNPLDANGGNIVNGNLEYAGPYSSFSTQNGHGCRSTLRVPSSGKWYVESANVTYSGSGNSCMLGFTSSNQVFTATAFGGTLTPWIGVDASVFSNSMIIRWNGVSGSTSDSTTLFASYASGDIINFAIDFDAGRIWIGKNGTWYNSGNPAAGTNATSTFTVGSGEWTFWGEYVASSTNTNRSSVSVNFGQKPFKYTPPTGFLPICTANLPRPTIVHPDRYVGIVTYTGNNSTQSITGLGFQPDFVWSKCRNVARSHRLSDSVRGSNTDMYSDTTAKEASDGSITAFTANGFNLNNATGSTYNTSGENYVAWCWKAGGPIGLGRSFSIDGVGYATAADAGMNTGTITPDGASVNRDAGFSILTWTGTGASGATINHGLGKKPAFIIQKARDDGTYGWNSWHKDIGTDYYISLNSTGARDNSVNIWPAAGITDSTFQTATSAIKYNNLSGVRHIAYCWAEIEGFSKFGSYVGNGNADGPFVYCGFRPAFLLLKRTDTGYWGIYDAVRNTYNAVTSALYPNDLLAELTDQPFDFLANGFKVRGTTTFVNSSGGTYIFAAFAEAPTQNLFGGQANAR